MASQLVPILEMRRRPAPVPGSLILNAAVDSPTFDGPSFGNETWRYPRPDGDLVLSFAAQDDPDDYRLVESILELNVAYDAMLDRADELPGLAQLVRSGPMGRVGLANEERLRGKRSIEVATTTSTWPRTYPVTMGGRVQWLTAGIRDGRALVHIVYGVDAAMLQLVPTTPRTGLIPIAVRAVFLDQQGSPIASLDTVELLRRPTNNTGLVVARAEVPVPPGTAHMRLNIEANRLIGAVYPLDTLGVPDVHGSTLSLSSILLGIPGRSLPWPISSGDTVWLAPSGVFLPSDNLEIFLQGYGLHPGVSYTVHLGLTRQRSLLARWIGGKHESITLSDHLVFAETSGEVRRSLALQGLEPGTYQLDVVVEGAGAKVARRRTIVITTPKVGTD